MSLGTFYKNNKLLIVSLFDPISKKISAIWSNHINKRTFHNAILTWRVWVRETTYNHVETIIQQLMIFCNSNIYLMDKNNLHSIHVDLYNYHRDE